MQEAKTHLSGSDPGKLAWNAGHCCGLPVDLDIDDVGFLAALINRLRELFLIDGTRIYAAGISNGAMMSHRLAADRPEVLAAIGATAGTIGGCIGSDCEELDQDLILPPVPGMPVPVILFHGFLDMTVLIQGGRGKDRTRFDIQLSRELSALHPEWGVGTGPASTHGSVDFWVRANGLDNAPLVGEVPHKDGASCTKLVYDLPEPTFEVIAYACKNIGHTHPTCSSVDPQPCIDGPTEVWSFFMRHTRL